MSDHVTACAQEAIQRAVEALANVDTQPAFLSPEVGRALAWARLASRMLALEECPHTDPKLFKDLKP